MDRREFSKSLALGVLGAATPPVADLRADGARPLENGRHAVVKRADRKEWARQYFKGLENFLLPSFTPDFRHLDEEAIRNDVRHAVRHGFVSTTVLGTGLTRVERARALEVAADEGRGKILIGTTVGGVNTFADWMDDLKHADKIGVSQTLLTLDGSAASEQDLYESSKRLIESTNLGIVLYALPTPAFVKFHPSGIPIDVLDRLADLPNVIAVKFTQVMNLAAAYQLAERLSTKILLGPVLLDAVPLLANKYKVQWSGEWAADAVQSPEKPYAVEFVDLVSRRQMDKAMKVYWTMQPALQAFFDLQAPTLRIGGHPWSHIKYYQWVTGGNGGVLRDLKMTSEQVPVLDSAGRAAIKQTLLSVGIKPVDLPDEAFVVGNAAYARGVRAKDLVTTPHYVQ